MRIPNASTSPLSTRATTAASGVSSGACTYDLILGGAVTLARTRRGGGAQRQSQSATALTGRGRYGVASHGHVAGRPQSFPADGAGERLEGGLRASAVARVAR